MTPFAELVAHCAPCGETWTATEADQGDLFIDTVRIHKASHGTPITLADLATLQAAVARWELWNREPTTN